jgi:hypothetical protein
MFNHKHLIEYLVRNTKRGWDKGNIKHFIDLCCLHLYTKANINYNHMPYITLGKTQGSILEK